MKFIKIKDFSKKKWFTIGGIVLILVLFGLFLTNDQATSNLNLQMQEYAERLNNLNMFGGLEEGSVEVDPVIVDDIYKGVIVEYPKEDLIEEKDTLVLLDNNYTLVEDDTNINCAVANVYEKTGRYYVEFLMADDYKVLNDNREDIVVSYIKEAKSIVVVDPMEEPLEEPLEEEVLPRLVDVGTELPNEIHCGGTSDVFVYNLVQWSPSAGQSKMYSDKMSANSTSTITPITEGLIAYYKLNQNGLDSSGRNLNGVPLEVINTTGWLNGAYQFDGINDNVNITGDLGIGNSSQMTISAWIKHTTSATQTNVIASEYASNTAASWYFGSSQNVLGNVPTFYISKDGGVTNRAYIVPTITLENNTWYHLTGTYDGNTGSMKMYINGVEVAVTLSGTVPAKIFESQSNNLRIGVRTTATADYFNGTIDEVKIYNRSLSASEVQGLYQATNDEHTNGTMSYSICIKDCIPQSENRIVHYAFNNDSTIGESNTLAVDVAYGENNGTIVGAKVNTTAYFNKALSFDKADDYVNISNTASMGFNSSFTMSMWIYYAGESTSTEYIYTRGFNTTGYSIWVYRDSADKLNFRTRTIPAAVVETNSLTTLLTGKWYNAVVKYDGVKQYLYIDGKLEDTIAQTGQLMYGNAPSAIGISTFTMNNEIQGNIDNFIIWNVSLSDSEIYKLYRSGYENYINGSYTYLNNITFDGNPTVTVSSSNAYPSFTSLVEPTANTTAQLAYYKFDNNALDSSGRGNNPAAVNNVLNDTGFFNGAYNFNGANSIINITTTNAATEAMMNETFGSVCAWMKPTLTGAVQHVVTSADESGTDYFLSIIRIDTTNAISYTQKNGDTADTVISNLILDSNNWNYVCTISNGTGINFYLNGVKGTSVISSGINNGDWFGDTINKDNIVIGVLKRNTVASWYSGLLDDLIVYNVTLTDAQVLANFNSQASYYTSQCDTRAVAHYKLDEDTNDCAGRYNSTGSVTAKNVNAQFNRGYFYERGTSSFTNLTNTNTQLLNSTQAYTVSMWVNIPAIYSQNILLDKYTSATCLTELALTDGRLRVITINGASTSATVTTTTSPVSPVNTWHHVMYAFDGTNPDTTLRYKLYADGIMQPTTTSGNVVNTTCSSAATLRLGRGASFYYNGSIDDVRIYNYTLNYKEAWELYNARFNATSNTITSGQKLDVSSDFLNLDMNCNQASCGYNWLNLSYSSSLTGSGVPPEDTTPPTCVLVSRTPTDILDNSTGLFNFIINCTDPSGINTTQIGDSYQAFVTKTIDNYIISAGIPNYFSNTYPNNSLGVVGDLTPPYKIWRAVGRNEGYWYDSLGNYNLTFNNDTFSYAINDGRYGGLVITNDTATTAVINFTGLVELNAFRMSFYLSLNSQNKAQKYDYSVNSNDLALAKLFDAEAYRDAQNYTRILFINMNNSGTTSRNAVVFYCNDSYNPAGAVTPSTSPNCQEIIVKNVASVNTKDLVRYNSTYFFTSIGATEGKIAGIKATSEYYLAFDTSGNIAGGSANEFKLKYMNSTTSTGVNYNDTKVAWTSTNNGATWTQRYFTFDIMSTATRKVNEELQIGLYIEDMKGNAYVNLTMFADAIAPTNHPISKPSIIQYNSTAYENDVYKNQTHSGIMNIQINPAKDPDTVDNVTHILYLSNIDGTTNYTINGSFKSPDDSDVWVNFDTTLVRNGVYRMNVSATANDNPLDIKSYITQDNFTIGNPSYPTFSNWNEDPASPLEYVAGTTSRFNITITAPLADISNVVVEFNLITGESTNYTATKTGDVYNISFVGLSVGTWAYRYHANSSTGHWNSSAQYLYLVRDTTAPIITLVRNGTVTSTTAHILWTTNELANSSVWYNTTADLGYRKNSATLGLTRDMYLTGLTASSTYLYNVTSCDSYNNCNTTGTYSFTTSTAIVPPTTGSNCPTIVGRMKPFTKLGCSLAFP